MKQHAWLKQGTQTEGWCGHARKATKRASSEAFKRAAECCAASVSSERKSWKLVVATVSPDVEFPSAPVWNPVPSSACVMAPDPVVLAGSVSTHLSTADFSTATTVMLSSVAARESEIAVVMSVTEAASKATKSPVVFTIVSDVGTVMV